MVRLQDIADMAGVSRTTVSNVLNGNTKKVSRETVVRINKILEEVDYVPNMGSLLLAKNSSKLIGLVIGYEESHGYSAMQDPFIGELMAALQKEVERTGYYLMIINGEHKRNIIDIASRWNIDGLIAIGLKEEYFQEITKQLNKPLVSIDAYLHQKYKVVNIGTDDFDGGYKAGRFLVEMGFTQALFVSETDVDADYHRWMGFQKAMQESGGSCGTERKIGVSHYERNRLNQYKGRMKEFLESGAVFCASDFLAVEMINFCREMNVNVPEELSVIGFDDNMYARIVSPKLTTIRQDVDRKVAVAFEKLMCLINNREVPERNRLLPVEIVIRDSVTKRNK